MPQRVVSITLVIFDFKRTDLDMKPILLFCCLSMTKSCVLLLFNLVINYDL